MVILSGELEGNLRRSHEVNPYIFGVAAYYHSQLPPSHRATKALLLGSCPTAQTSLADIADTLLSPASLIEPEGLEMACIVHVLPFECSMSGTLIPLASSCRPGIVLIPEPEKGVVPLPCETLTTRD